MNPPQYQPVNKSQPAQRWQSLTIHIQLYSWCSRHIPMVMWLLPRVVELTSQRCVVKIPLNWRSRNHLGSMYFGALCVGADLSGALMAMGLIKSSDNDDQRTEMIKVSLVFQDMQADFVRRAEQHTIFICEDGELISACVHKAHTTNERHAVKVKVSAYEELSEQLVAQFVLTLSIKSKPSSRMTENKSI